MKSEITISKKKGKEKWGQGRWIGMKRGASSSRERRICSRYLILELIFVLSASFGRKKNFEIWRRNGYIEDSESRRIQKFHFYFSRHILVNAIESLLWWKCICHVCIVNDTLKNTILKLLLTIRIRILRLLCTGMFIIYPVECYLRSLLRWYYYLNTKYQER